MEQSLQCFAKQLQQKLRRIGHFVPLYVHHEHQGAIFCSHTKFMGCVWRDWAIVDWGPEGKLPCQTMGFFDLTCLTCDKSSPCASLGGLRWVTPGIHAIVECAYFPHDSSSQSELFCPIFKKFSPNAPVMSQWREFFLADVEAIVDAMAVIPDIGCPKKNTYFLLQPHCKWREMFNSWLDLPHETINLNQLEDFFSSNEEEDASNGD